MNNQTKFALGLFAILFIVYGHSSILNLNSEHIFHNQIKQSNYNDTLVASSQKDAEKLINERINKYSGSPECMITGSHEVSPKSYKVEWSCTYDIALTDDRYLLVSMLIFIAIMLTSIIYLGKRMTTPLHFLVVVFAIEGGLLTWLFWVIGPVYFGVLLGNWNIQF